MSKNLLRKSECACEGCQRACRQVPGWFRPGEAEKAAAHLNLSLRVFFKRYLAVQWWEGADKNTFALAPALKGAESGAMYPANPKGECVFFQGGRCAIHPVKPWDCSHGNPHDAHTDAKHAAFVQARARTVALWTKRQDQIASLLGRKPRAAVYSFLEAMFW